MKAITALCRDIVCRHGIAPDRVLAHSDVAPARKIDPGEKFDWPGLHREGVGHWVEPMPVNPEDRGFSGRKQGPEVLEAQELLARYGYGIEPTGIYSEQMKTVLNSISEVRTWRTDIPNCFYVVSEADAKVLGTLIREKTGKTGRFIISELPENRYGWLTKV